MGEAKSRPQNFSASGPGPVAAGTRAAGTDGLTVAMACIIAYAPVLEPEGPMFHIVLVEPEIPPNTGNIIRLCANSGCTLHLVQPLGFELTGKQVRRAGLDYDELAPVQVHAGLTECLLTLAAACSLLLGGCDRHAKSEQYFLIATNIGLRYAGDPGQYGIRFERRF